jgi:hypothetical protein
LGILLQSRASAQDLLSIVLEVRFKSNHKLQENQPTFNTLGYEKRKFSEIGTGRFLSNPNFFQNPIRTEISGFEFIRTEISGFELSWFK